MDAKAVGQRIKTAREKKNLTQEDLAALVEISPTHVRCDRARHKNSTNGYLCRNRQCP